MKRILTVINNRSISFKLVFFILSSCALIFSAIFIYSYGVSRRILIEKIESAAESLISGTVHNIETKILPAEKVPEYISLTMADPYIDGKDIEGFIRSALEKNPEIYGSAIAFEPYAFKKERYYYSPYMYREGKDIKFTDLGNDSYDYFNWDWYKIPKELGHSVWSEPYYDKGGGDTLMVTYSAPFYRIIDGRKKFSGVVTADLSLSWLKEMVSSLKIGQTGYGFLVSKEGRLITHPDKNIIMKKMIFNEDDSQKGGLLSIVGRAMKKEKIGFVLTTEPDTGQKVWIAYAPLPATGWYLAAVFQKTELLEELHKLNSVVAVVGGVGLLFLAAVITLFANSITKPLKVLALKTRNIAKGDMDFDLPGPDSKDEVGSLSQAFRYMKVELSNYIERLTRTTQEKEKIESELKIASIIQLGTLPRVAPPYTGRNEFELCATIKPAKEVGGDFYDFYFIDDEHLAFVIGDVSGKGVPAAIYMAIAKTYIHAVAKTVKEPVEVMRKVNEELSCDNVSEMFVTVFFGVLNIKTGEISYANAGHNPPFIIHRDGETEKLDGKGGCMLGVFEDSHAGGGDIRLKNGDILFMYTDGVTEAMDTKREEFSCERLEKVLLANKKEPIEKIAEEVLSGIADFARGAPQADDITTLSLMFKG